MFFLIINKTPTFVLKYFANIDIIKGLKIKLLKCFLCNKLIKAEYLLYNPNIKNFYMKI